LTAGNFSDMIKLIKAQYAISYANAFVAFAQELEATIVTADPEFQKVESVTSILWL
jgi:hypothetical protein